MTLTGAFRSRYLWLAMAVLLLAFVRVVPLALANHHVLQSPTLALHYRSDQPEALVASAEFAGATGDWREAARLSKAAIAADPFNGRAVRVLAEAMENVSSQAVTLQLMRIALARAPLDFDARYWLIQNAEMRGDAATAVRYYERLLRLEPESGPEVFPAMAKQLSLVLRSGSPVRGWFADAPWREAFLANLARQEEPAAGLDALFREARAAGGLSAKEKGAWVDHYVRMARWNEAAERWRELTGHAGPVGARVSNGDFEHDMGPPPFDWSITSPPGVDVTVDMSGSSHLLRVDFLGQRSPFNHVAQLVLLPAGQYALTWRSRGEGFRASRGLQWTLHCAFAGGERLLATPNFPRAQDERWVPQREAFEVPAACPAQWLRLSLEARIPADTEAYGTVLLDDIGIVPVAASAPARS